MYCEEEKPCAKLTKLAKNINIYLPVVRTYQNLISCNDTLGLLNVHFKGHLWLETNSHVFRSHGLIPPDLPLDGFKILLNKSGDLIHVSTGVENYVDLTAAETMLAYKQIFPLICKEDEETMKIVLRNECNLKRTQAFFVAWIGQRRRTVSKADPTIVKIEGFFLGENEEQLFLAVFTPVITVFNRNRLTEKTKSVFKTAHSKDLSCLEICRNAELYLGTVENVTNKSLYDLIHPNDLLLLEGLHRELIASNSATGSIFKTKIKRIDGNYVNCLINIYFKTRDYIICHYQVYSASEMTSLLRYLELNEDMLPVHSRICHLAENAALGDHMITNQNEDVSAQQLIEQTLHFL